MPDMGPPIELQPLTTGALRNWGVGGRREMWGTEGDVKKNFFKKTGYQPQRAEMHVKGRVSVSPDSCTFPNIETPKIPSLDISGFL